LDITDTALASAYTTAASLDPNRPLLILDADEVLLQFVTALEAYLDSEGYDLRLNSFQITGNVFARTTGVAATAEDVTALIDGFFATSTDSMTAVAGAADAVNHLAQHCDVIILSNVPAQQSDARRRNLARHGFDYPLIANSGGKGPAVAALMGTSHRWCGFVDDLPPQHSSVAQHAPDTHRIHLVADQRLRPLIPQAADAHIRIDDWDAVSSHILQEIDQHGRALS